MKTTRRSLVVVMGLLAQSACARPDMARERLTPAEASARVSELLYGQNLISDPQVNQKMNEYVLAVSRDGIPADSVLSAFHLWLTEWARANPGRVAQLRIATEPDRN
jgi:hypothetical protein